MTHKVNIARYRESGRLRVPSSALRTVHLSVLLFLLFLLPAAAFSQNALTATNQVDHVLLSWTPADVPGAVYSLYRLVESDPEGTQPELLATLAGTSYSDTVRRTLCHDTLAYTLYVGTVLHGSRRVHFTDAAPTSMPVMGLCSVDSLSQRILLTWSPSPDTDILGYYVYHRVNGVNFKYDSVYGDTAYLVPPALPATSVDTFMVNAFDICHTGSAMTAPCNNLVLRTTSPDCSTVVSAEWNPYANHPDAPITYRLQLLDGVFRTIVDNIPASQHAATYDALPSTALSATFRLQAVGRGGRLVANSNVVTHTFSTSDTARFLRIRSLTVGDEGDRVTLVTDVDPLHEADYTLFRTEGGQTRQVAVLPYSPSGSHTHVDPLGSPSSAVGYHLTVPDGCGRNPKTSATASPMLLEVDSTSDVADACRLRWTPYRPLEGRQYRLLRREGADAEWSLVAATSATSYLDIGPASGQSRYYKVILLEGADTVQSNVAARVEPTALWAPNAFTPDEGTNRRWRVEASGVGDYRLRVYSRAGHQVFAADSPAESWDGTCRGRPVPQGVYVWCVFYRDTRGLPRSQTGTVLVVR